MTETIDYLLVGPITADVVSGNRILGGTVSYAAPVAWAFGLKVGIVTSAAANEPLLTSLKPFAQIIVREAQHTTTFENIYTQHHGRIQYIHHTAAPLTFDDIPSRWLSAKLVHLAPLANNVDPKIAHHFPNATVMFTPQGWMRRRGEDGRIHFKQWFDEDALQAADIVVFSRQDIKEAPDMEQKFARAVRHLIITDGENGGIYYHVGLATPYSAVKVEEKEPTGAGDVFAASLLASLIPLNYDMNKAVRLAAELAAICITRVGVSFLTPAEIQDILHKVQSL